jgi:hypothetical protein
MSRGAVRVGDKFSGEVSSQVPLQYDPHLPTQGAYRLNCHHIHLSRGAAELQYRAYEVTRN